MIEHLTALLSTLVTTLGLIVVAWIGNRKIGALGRDVRATREDAHVTRAQTENEHSSAEYPNLRDELTEVRQGGERTQEALGTVLDALVDVKQALRRHDSEIGGVREDLRQQRDWFGGEQVERRLLTRALNEHLPHAAERDRLIAVTRQEVGEVRQVLDSLVQEVRSHHDDAPPGMMPDGA